MKQIAKILLAIVMTTVFLPANADDTSNAKPVSSTKLEKTVVDTQTPRTLGDLFITCYYNNECLEVEFPADIDSMDITHQQRSGAVYEGIFSIISFTPPSAQEVSTTSWVDKN